jgi:hypothetical protein
VSALLADEVEASATLDNIHHSTKKHDLEVAVKGDEQEESEEAGDEDDEEEEDDDDEEEDLDNEEEEDDDDGEEAEGDDDDGGEEEHEQKEKQAARRGALNDIAEKRKHEQDSTTVSHEDGFTVIMCGQNVKSYIANNTNLTVGQIIAFALADQSVA